MPHRQKLNQLINRYEHRYPSEDAVIRRIRHFIQANPECFQRHLAAGHVTGSAWVLDAEGTAVLLTHHKKLNIWVQLGGHADGESNIAEVAMREAREESGLDRLKLVSPEIFDIDIHAIPARGDEPAHWHYDCRFLFQAAAGQNLVVSDESHALAWVALPAVNQISAEASLLRMVSKTPNGLGSIGGGKS